MFELNCHTAWLCLNALGCKTYITNGGYYRGRDCFVIHNLYEVEHVLVLHKTITYTKPWRHFAFLVNFHT